MKDVLAVLLAGGVGERLHPLTRNRAKPAVPFGGMYRIIDFTLSNCLNSQCKKMLILVQYKSQSLQRHLRFAWGMVNVEMGEFVDVVPPQQRVNSSWYLGTADAIYQNLWHIQQEEVSEILVLASDHIYKMDYMKMVQFHREREAQLTIASIEVPIEEASRFGVLETGPDGRVTSFEEKPVNPVSCSGHPDKAFASMGVYVFNAKILKHCVVKDACRESSSHDFGKDVIPRLIDTHHVFAYNFRDENKKDANYWRDVGTLDAYWEANMDLVQVDPVFNLYDKTWPIYTKLPMAPPAKFVFNDEDGRRGMATDSLISSGCIVSGGQAIRSILSPNVRLSSYSHVEESIILNDSVIGRHCRIRRAIIEKKSIVPPNTVIGYDLQADARKYRITEGGIVVVEAVRAELPENRGVISQLA